MTNVKVTINDVAIEATNFQQEQLQNDEKARRKISFDFKVRSEQSHDITTLLYKNDFIVKVQEKELEFQATIYNYSTSITDLTVKDAVGDFKLELIEKV
ncbi:DUF3219 family protein [Oceanobacillus chungangensis]|uniref:DUF3219 domain-containing protein n=1 Tax=Oceanobacillus chungangensis TaxID=1229152 RepID=A0A3D8PZN3_9BACI|nr:DUF3219 family protein [Oceanobacillus chungangensis]RDW21262.1 DUF3219 domain-containing protein [Oceanobacillus chungangensis]